MAKKKPSTARDKNAGAPSSTEKKLTPKELRAAQDRRNRNIVVGILSVLLVVLLVVLGVLIYKAKSGSNNTSGDTPDSPEAGISSVVVGAEGVGKPTEGVPTVEFYYSYGCPGCIQIEHLYYQEFQKGIQDGKYNMEFFPVGTHGLPWTYVAGFASMQVAEKQPEKFLDFHEALIEFGNSIMFKDEESAKAQGNGTVLADPVGSLEEVKRIGGEVGVDTEIIQSFVSEDEAKPIVNGWSDQWVEKVGKFIDDDRIGTPMFTKNEKRISPSDYFPRDEETTKELEQLKESDPAKYQERVQELSEKAYRDMIADFGK